MLSIENPPPDPPCSFQFLKLKSGSDEIERPPHNLPLSELDLLKQPSLDNHQHQNHHTPLPKFSIRDYVFTARSKDIKKSWPFSPKNLQLCLKHGLKDPLPPFQPLDTVRNQLIERCAVETNPFEKQNTKKFDEELSGSNDNVVQESSYDAHSDHNLAGACIDNSSCRSGEHENDLPFTTASVSQSEIDSVFVNKQSNLPIETNTLVEASVEVKASGTFKSQNTENTTRSSGKKCRLIVKFGAHSERSSTEDTVPNCTMVSESMTSKVCPVCKTFSSSSNTTLNAHIDQCLSVESTPKWTVDSKFGRHRIKPRKSRLMVDVYATAKPCTLEELDRRNGTSWATAPNISRQDSERLQTSNEGKKQRVSPINPEDFGEEGAVYIDANGTKLRILSKFNDVPPVPKVGDDIESHKSLKGGKGSKFSSTKKKRCRAPKHHKYLKLAPPSRKLFARKTGSSTIFGAQQEGCCGVEQSCKIGGPHPPKKTKSIDSRTFIETVCSKQAGLSRKSNDQDRHQPLICEQHVTRDLRDQSDQWHQVDRVVERNCVRKFKNSSENPIPSPENCERVEKPAYEAPIIDKRERSLGRKRVRSPLFGTRLHNKVERSLHPLKQNANQLRKDNLYQNEDPMVRPLDSGGNCTSSLSKKMVDIDANSNPHTPATATTTFSCHSLASKCFGFSSPKKNVMSASSRSSMVKKYSTWESQLDITEEIDEEAVALGPEADQDCDLVHDGAENQYEGKEITEELSFGGSSVHGAGEQRGSISRREETMALKSIQSTPHCYDHDERENTDSSTRGSEEILDKVDGLESAEETVTSLSQSVETKFNKLSNLSKNRSNSLQTNEEQNGPLCGSEGLADPSGPSLVDKSNMFCAEVGHGIFVQAATTEGELDSDAAQRNSFPEVDPIPIPGPPGSFLPSPRDMVSDDFQGNSSLTTSRIQSSQDQFDFVDGDSSDSPISAASTISNSVEARSDLKYAEPLAFVGAPAALVKDRSGCSTAKSEAFVGNCAVVPQTSAGPERTFEGEKFRVHGISVDKRSVSFENDDQPCCCQRKERSSPGFALNYKDSQLRRRRTMASMMVPAVLMQIGANPNITPNNLDARPETFSLGSSASLGSEQLVPPVMNPPAGPFPFKGCPDAGVKLSSRGDCDSASPSSSNPVLRLMGKNLMVVNKEEDASMPLGQAQSCAQSNCLTPNLPSSSGISPSNTRNPGGLSFNHVMPQDSFVLYQNPNNLVGQSFDIRLANGYRNCANLASPQTSMQFPPSIFLDEYMDGGFTTSMELHENEGNCNLPTRPNRPKNSLGPAATYDMEKVATLGFRHWNGASAVSSKEVIVIDDAPENETNKTADVINHSEGLRESQIVSSGILMPFVPNNSARHRNLFSHYQSEDCLLGDPTVVQNNNFHVIPPSRRANTSHVMWDCTSEGSSLLQQGPFIAVSPSRSHIRPSLYYSPNLS